MQNTVAVQISSFGQGRYEALLPAPEATVAAAVGQHALETQGRRIAVNGQTAGLSTPVLEGDEVTLVPRVQGG